MPKYEIAPNIERIYPEGGRTDRSYFVADTEPPRYAVLGAIGDDLSVSGPMTEAQLQVEVAHSNDSKNSVYMILKMAYSTAWTFTTFTLTKIIQAGWIV